MLFKYQTHCVKKLWQKLVCIKKFLETFDNDFTWFMTKSYATDLNFEQIKKNHFLSFSEIPTVSAKSLKVNTCCY